MTEMAEIPNLDSNTSCDAFESEQNTRKFSVSDHMNAFQFSPEKSDSFVIDMDAFPSGISKDSNRNSRITLQKSLSRKGSQRGSDKKVSGNIIHDKDTVPTGCSPKGSGMAEKPVVAVGSMDHSTSPQVHHHITVTAGNFSTASTTTESKSVGRRNSFRRTWWAVDPKRVLLFFATLSSMGTMLLIYFTLTISKQNPEEYGG